ncbi:MAG: CDP-glucose 4,6-dehydratase [Verrucomicrobia bacterium]|nr:CDP-glucose 4,6-dehydratase [Verrucomicrobiota bacterium]
MFGGYYQGKRVLVTGHTGFKGAWLSLWLRQLGAQVCGLALPPENAPNLHELIQPGTFAAASIVDIRDADAVAEVVRAAKPDFVFHLAAQALVRRSYAAPVETMQTNVLGTVHMLEAVRQLRRPVPMLVVTTDKCYENHGWDHGYRETDALGGHDVYAASKAACEIVVGAWQRSFFQPDAKLGNVATARAGNVIGGGDFATDRIVPDCVRALASKAPIRVRNPHATRPWQHVLDCLSGYLWLGACLATAPKNSPLAGAFNFGPALQANRTVGVLVEELLRHWPGQWLEASDPKAPHEAGRLHLAIDKSAAQLGWQPTWDFADTVKHTALWYRRFAACGGRGSRAFTVKQIADFSRAAKTQGQAWAAAGKAT